jgi:hypothetical protein
MEKWRGTYGRAMQPAGQLRSTRCLFCVQQALDRLRASFPRLNMSHARIREPYSTQL